LNREKSAFPVARLYVEMRLRLTLTCLVNRTIRPRRAAGAAVAIGFCCCMLPDSAAAHITSTGSGRFGSGFAHPLTGRHTLLRCAVHRRSWSPAPNSPTRRSTRSKPLLSRGSSKDRRAAPGVARAHAEAANQPVRYRRSVCLSFRIRVRSGVRYTGCPLPRSIGRLRRAGAHRGPQD
jgi:hypothetical protein